MTTVRTASRTRSNTHALATDPHAFNPFPAGQFQTLTVNETTDTYLTTNFNRLIEATDIVYHVQYSENFQSGDDTAVLISAVRNNDGTVTETWCAPFPASGKGFLRVGTTPKSL
jgi:hypothetical protein